MDVKRKIILFAALILYHCIGKNYCVILSHEKGFINIPRYMFLVCTEKFTNCESKYSLVTTYFSIFPKQSGISGQLLFDLKNGYETAQNVTLNDTRTQAQPTNITSDGKLCDPNVQQHR